MPDQLKDPIREAFTKAKQDILNLQSQLSIIKQEVQSLKLLIQQTHKYFDKQTNRQTNTPTHSSTQNQTQELKIPTIQHIIPTQTQSSTHPSTDNLTLKAVKSKISDISIGNEGVPTDRQTDRQTDTSTRNKGVKIRLIKETASKEMKIDNLQKVSEVINSLDDIKKDLRKKLKRLTNQETLVFTTIYQLEEEKYEGITYSIIAQKLSLTESSIRDYTKRIIDKGVPITKTKENNKKVILSISPELKKIASLSTILQLREL